MKETARAAIQSTYKSIGVARKRGLFELFGMDFMIDEAFRPWLIEINTNPCLETSSRAGADHSYIGGGPV